MAESTVADGQQLLPLIDHLARVGRRATDTCSSGCLRPRHLIALKVLGERGPLTQHALGAALSLDPSNVVGLLNELEERDLITRRRDPADRRRHIVELSDSGSAELTRTYREFGVVEDDLFKMLTAEERATLYSLLSRAVAALAPADSTACTAAECAPSACTADGQAELSFYRERIRQPDGGPPMLRRLLILFVLIAGVSLVPLLPADAAARPPHQILSNYENATKASLARDCGFSQPVPGKHATSLWLFCDTAVYGFNSKGAWGLTGFITGSTAAEGPAAPGLVPTNLSELTSVNTRLPKFPNRNAPAHFLTIPTGLVTAEGGKCGATSASYAASWISGVARDPAKPSDLLISFDNYCVEGAFKFHPEGFGLAVYDPANNKLTTRLVFKADTKTGLTLPQQVLSSPVVYGGYLYLYNYRCASPSFTCPASAKNAVYLARVRATPSAWDNPSAYRWFTKPDTWTSSPGRATSVIAGATVIAGLNVGDYRSVGQRFVLIAQESLEGAFTAYEAPTPAGPWRVKTKGTVACPSNSIDCHAIIGHPELSTRKSLLISFYNPGAVPFYNPTAPASTDGHLELAAFPW